MIADCHHLQAHEAMFHASLRLRQVVINLVSALLRSCDQGENSIRIALKEDNGERVRMKTHAGDDYRILLVGDNIINRCLTRRLLEKCGHRVDAVEHGDQTRERLGEQVYDLILMDF